MTTTFYLLLIVLLLIHPFTPTSSSSPFVLQTNPSLYSSELNILSKIYEEQDGDKKKFLVRNVPGYGSCLFYSLAACITFDRCLKHLVFHTKRMKLFVAQLRLKAVEELQDNTDPNRFFHLDNHQKMSVQDVLKAAANNVHMKETDYLKEMLQSKTWGGGPEIVALSNYFKRPIHVYELCRHTRFKSFFRLEHEFKLKLCAKFGSPIFDKDNETPYCILCADGRFPHVFPGFHKQKGDHFLALFPVVNTVTNGKDNEESKFFNGSSSSSSSSSSTAKGNGKLHKGIGRSTNNNQAKDRDKNCDDDYYLKEKVKTRLRRVSPSSSSTSKEKKKENIEHIKYAYDYHISDDKSIYAQQYIDQQGGGVGYDDNEISPNIFKL